MTETDSSSLPLVNNKHPDCYSNPKMKLVMKIPIWNTRDINDTWIWIIMFLFKGYNPKIEVEAETFCLFIYYAMFLEMWLLTWLL